MDCLVHAGRRYLFNTAWAWCIKQNEFHKMIVHCWVLDSHFSPVEVTTSHLHSCCELLMQSDLCTILLPSGHMLTKFWLSPLFITITTPPNSKALIYCWMLDFRNQKWWLIFLLIVDGWYFMQYRAGERSEIEVRCLRKLIGTYVDIQYMLWVISFWSQHACIQSWTCLPPWGSKLLLLAYHCNQVFVGTIPQWCHQEKTLHVHTWN